MGEFFRRLFSSDYMGHGYCYLWRPEIIWLHAISDGIIAFSYYFIPLMLIYLVRKRRDLPFHWIFFMFGVFILSCGTTHAMEIWTLWHGTYRLAGVIKAVTALASLSTGVMLVPMVPKALLLPSPSQLRAANLELQKENAERRRVEEVLEGSRNFVEAVLNTVSTAIIVLDVEGKIVQCNRACEQISGHRESELVGTHVWNLFPIEEEAEGFQGIIDRLLSGRPVEKFENYWRERGGTTHLMSWSATALTDAGGAPRHIIAAGVDITESKRMEETILNISAMEQARIGQDLHDGLGQHLTGIAFLSKVLERKLSERLHTEEAADAGKIVELVNESINQTRELSRGLLPVSSGALGLMSALERWSDEVEDLFGITCRLNCPEPVLIYNDNVATHLFRITQEAVNNAIKHGHPTHIEISFGKLDEDLALKIKDNGRGLPENLQTRRGIGLEIMNYRARMIGGTLRVERSPEGGTIVTCQMRPGMARSSLA